MKHSKKFCHGVAEAIAFASISSPPGESRRVGHSIECAAGLDVTILRVYRRLVTRHVMSANKAETHLTQEGDCYKGGPWHA